MGARVRPRGGAGRRPARCRPRPVRPRPARRRLDERRRGRGRPGRRGGGRTSRAPGTSSRSARRSSTSRPTTSSTARSASRTSSRTSPRRARSTAGRSWRASGRSGDGWIVRSSWLFGVDGPQLRPHDARASAPSATRSPSSTTSAAARPTSVTSPRRRATLVELPYGLYHVAAEGDCTWADFAEAIFEEAGLDCRVRRITTAELGRRRPAPGLLGSPLREARDPAPAALARGPPRLPRAAFSNLSGDEVLVTGGAGFIGSHFAKRLAARGRRGRRPRQADLLRATRRISTARTSSSSVGDICDADAVAEAGAGCDAVVNFAAETHVDRSILGAAEFIETDVLGTYVLLDWAREPAPASSRSRPTRSTATSRRARAPREGDPLRPSSPYSASKAGGDLQVLAAVRTFGVDACITRGANTYGPNQYPEKLIPLFVTNALDGEPLPRLRRRPPAPRVAPRRRPLRRGRARAARRARAGEVYNVGGEEHENLEITSRILELTGATQRSSATSTTGPATTAATRSTTRSCARSAGPGALARWTGLAGDGRLVPREPRLVGADQVRRVPRVLRAAVRRRACAGSVPAKRAAQTSASLKLPAAAGRHAQSPSRPPARLLAAALLGPAGASPQTTPAGGHARRRS